MPENTASISKKVLPLVVGGALVAVAAVGGIILVSQNDKSNSTKNSTATATPTSSNSESSSSSNSGTYKDGTYTANGSYVSPGGKQSIDVTITLNENKIQSVNVTPKGIDPTSQQHEQDFADGIADIVVGKSIDSNFDVSRVNGSSLTGLGFKQAIENIKTQAKS